MVRWKRLTLTLGGPAVFYCAYKLKVEDEGLRVCFSAKKSPELLDSTGHGDFVEGLWRKDCGELWLASNDTGRYIELNLAPNGAWWACVFSDPRKRDLDCRPPTCKEIDISTKRLSWSMSTLIDWNDIRRCLQSDGEIVGNVTLIVGGCPDNDPPLKNLHSAVPLGEVDFHRPQDWVPLGELL